MLAPAGYASRHADLAVLTCYGNVAQAPRLRDNYLAFAAGLRRQGVPLFVVEAVPRSLNFELPETPQTLRTHTASVCWQKERLLNLLASQVPPQYTKLAWVDADLLFLNDGWAGEASEQLEELPVVQLFQSYDWLGEDGRPERTDLGFVAAYLARVNTGQTGYAWAARRELWDQHGGLFDRMGTDAADWMMAFAAVGSRPFAGNCLPSVLPVWLEWLNGFRVFCQPRAGVIAGCVQHLWHGALQSREYGRLPGLLSDVGFDLNSDQVLDVATGTWRLPRPEVEQVFVDYFSRRRSAIHA